MVSFASALLMSFPDWVADAESVAWGALLSCAIYAMSIGLHWMLPGETVVGYACRDTSIEDIRNLTLRNNTNNNRFVTQNQAPAPNPTLWTYKLNGMLVCTWAVALLIISVWFLCSNPDLLKQVTKSEHNDVSFLFWWAAASYYPYLGGCLAGCIIIGLAVTTALYRRGVAWCRAHDYVSREPLQCCTSADLTAIQNKTMRVASRRRKLISWNAYYHGVGEFNPRWRIRLPGILTCFMSWPEIRLDIKMWLYLAGTLMLEFHVLVLAGAHAVLYNERCMSNAMLISTICWTWFSVDYLSNEHVHLYTYDMFAERLGFKLVSGCLAIYPFLYPIGQWCMVPVEVSDQNDMGLNATIFTGALFLTGWIMTRGANYQKYCFKHQPERKRVLFGLLPQVSCSIRSESSGKGYSGSSIMRKNSTSSAQPVQQSNTQRPPRSLLISGFWGLSRHINYFGEMVQGFALGLPAFVITGSPLAFVYFLFIAGLLFHRGVDDERLCRIKYDEEMWKEYTTLVKYRIIPFVY